MKVKQYKEKAQNIYDTLLHNKPNKLNELLLELACDYCGDNIYTVKEWVRYYQDGGDMFELIEIVKDSKELNPSEKYIRTSVYCYGFKTSNDMIGLASVDEAVEWIASALKDETYSLEDIVKYVK